MKIQGDKNNFNVIFMMICFLFSLFMTNTSLAKRSIANRNQFLVEKGHCISKYNCKVPQGYEVDHKIPLWAGGGDVSANMQLLPVNIHRSQKTPKEATALNSFRKSGVVDLSGLPNWKNGVLTGKIVRVYRNYKVDVVVNMTLNGGDFPIRYTVPLAGIKKPDHPLSKDTIDQEMGNFKDLMVSFRPSDPIVIDMRTALGTMAKTSPKVVWRAGEESKSSSLNEFLLLNGLAAYNSHTKPKKNKVKKKLKRAYLIAKKSRTGYWANIPSPKKKKKKKKYRGGNYNSRAYSDYDSYGGGGGTVNVRGYYKSNGTYVAPHTRSAPSRRR